MAGVLLGSTSLREDNGRRPEDRNFLFSSHRVSCEEATQSVHATSAYSSSMSRNFVADAVAKVLPAVVRVEVHAKAKATSTGGTTTGASYNQRGTGSGFLVHAQDVLGAAGEGTLVVTNAHCVLTPQEFQQSVQEAEETSKTVYLEMADDRIVTGKIIAFDTERDVALIQPCFSSSSCSSCSSSPSNNTSSVTATLQLKGQAQTQQQRPWTTSSVVRHGEFVAALGAPLELENTVTIGIVSNPQRKCRHNPGKTYIQTDNSCHVGNSGGPLINMDGHVIGITAKKVADGIAYSIPIQDAVESLREAYYNKHPQQSLGVQEVSQKEKIEAVATKSNEISTPESPRRRSKGSESKEVDPGFFSLFPNSFADGVPVTISRRW